MKTIKQGNIEIPQNEFLPKKPELFNLNLKMPAQFKEEWLLFRKRCKEKGREMEFEDVLANLIVRFNNGEIKYKKQPPRMHHGSKKK